jgi:hypothetical protein
VIETTRTQRAYLRLQVGELADVSEHLWMTSYEAHLMSRMSAIRHALPAYCSAICDVGSGLGGIDVLLHRYFEGSPSVTLVDGDGPLEVIRHDWPFNDAHVAREFQRSNGVQEVEVLQPDDLQFQSRSFDLIVSFRAWCFHFEPARYLEWVLSTMHDRSVLIVEVRSGRLDWLDELRGALPEARCLSEGRKSNTWAFTRS